MNYAEKSMHELVSKNEFREPDGICSALSRESLCSENGSQCNSAQSVKTTFPKRSEVIAPTGSHGTPQWHDADALALDLTAIRPWLREQSGERAQGTEVLNTRVSTLRKKLA